MYCHNDNTVPKACALVVFGGSSSRFFIIRKSSCAVWDMGCVCSVYDFNGDAERCVCRGNGSGDISRGKKVKSGGYFPAFKGQRGVAVRYSG